MPHDGRRRPRLGDAHPGSSWAEKRAPGTTFSAHLRSLRGCAAAIAVVGLAGCGSLAADELPSAAEPAASPALSAEPAGRVVAVGRRPEGVVVDRATNTVAVALRDPPEVALLDARTGALRKRVAVPSAARHLATAGPGGPVLAPAERAGRLVRIALPGGAVGSSAAAAGAHDAVQAGGRAFVSGERADALAVVAPGAATRRVSTALQPGGVAALDHGRQVASVAVRERVLELFRADSLRRVGSAPAGTGPTHVVSDGGRYLYVADTDGGGLLVFDTRPELRLTRRYYLAGSPYGMAADRGRGRIWVTLTRTNEVAELSMGARPRLLRTFPTVRQPDSVAVEPVSGRVYVTGAAQGVLQLLDPPPLRPRGR